MIGWRAGLVFAVLLLVPGWALLALTGLWRRWEGLQRWLMALGLSLALYPVGFYLLRLIPGLTLGPYKLTVALVLAALWTGWRLRGVWRDLVRLEPLEWLAVGVLAATLFTRFWIIRDYPYPAWSDALHHTLLTHLTAVQGRLPLTLDPYEPVSLGMYHLGLYSVSASVAWLAQVPAHTALLWTAQVLNGLCGVGVYLLLDRKVGRWGALSGAVVAGLLSHQPSYYVNWGRFTQLAAQALLLIAFSVTWDTLGLWRSGEERRSAFSLGLVAALLSAAVFLYHFRVAAFYLPLLALTFASEAWSAWRQKQAKYLLLITGLIALGGLILISPALWEALRIYIARSTAPVEAQFAGDSLTYYTFPLKAIPILGPHPPLLWAAAFSLLLGWWRHRSFTLLVFFWTVLLMALGYAYLTPWRILHVTNLGAVVIMLYLPASLVMGAGAQALTDGLNRKHVPWGTLLVVLMLLVGGFKLAGPRLREIEPGRHFVTAADVAAMDWIKANTPADALFAVNTYTWMRSVPHGIDGGYWIPYFTGRRTTAGTMLSSLGSRDHIMPLITLSELVVQLDEKPATALALRDAGVDYVYVGARAFQAATAFNREALQANPALELVYDRDGVRIYRLP